jgi:hypothetical protein
MSDQHPGILSPEHLEKLRLAIANGLALNVETLGGASADDLRILVVGAVLPGSGQRQLLVEAQAEMGKRVHVEPLDDLHPELNEVGYHIGINLRNSNLEGATVSWAVDQSKQVVVFTFVPSSTPPAKGATTVHSKDVKLKNVQFEVPLSAFTGAPDWAKASHLKFLGGQLDIDVPLGTYGGSSS